MNRISRPKAGRLPLLLALVFLLSLGGTAALAGQLPVVIPTFQSPTGPPNDNFANATVISSLPYNDAIDINLATTEDGEPLNCYSTSKTIWYSFTPAQAVWVHVDMAGGSSETALSVYSVDNPGIGGLSSIGCSAWGPSIDFLAKAGLTYYFQAGAVYDWSPGVVQINMQELPPPKNDDFAEAATIESLGFKDDTDNRWASVESLEPTPSCSPYIFRTIWYTYTPTSDGLFSIRIDSWYGKAVAVYEGSDLGSLSEVACRVFNNEWMTLEGSAGTTYRIQVGTPWDEGGWLNVGLDLPPPPVAQFGFWPPDPSVFDTVGFDNYSWDPAGVGIQTVAWDLGDGTTSTDWSSPPHQYARDGDYTASLTVTTYDGRTASAQQTVSVSTHDVAIVKLVAPNAARVGQTRPIVVELKNSRYPERVRVELYKSTPFGYQFVATTDQNIPVRSGNRTTSVSLSYTFAKDDAVMGKVTFKATGYIVDRRDALMADNEAISSPTKVSK